ncbi:MAG: RHH-type transcriptional regulator, rel operon repressor / antitoxin RelB [Candidatus Atribacteria bacterium]|nr:RHH-type transcriptional regulator, rel operon repressor / antitoxin RelB [Candidatus Atribacteria bacterium]
MRNEVTLSTRVPGDLVKKLEDLAKKTDRTKSYLVRKALEEYLEELEDYLIAFERYTSGNKEYLTTDEVKHYLGI